MQRRKRSRQSENGGRSVSALIVPLVAPPLIRPNDFRGAARHFRIEIPPTIYLSALDFAHKRRGAAADMVSRLPQHTLSSLLKENVELIESVAIASLLASSPFMVAEPPMELGKLREHIAVANRELAGFFGFPPITLDRKFEKSKANSVLGGI